MNLLVNIDIEDLEKGTRFYCEAFGLRVGRRFDGGFELLGSTAPLYLLAKAAGTPASPMINQKRDYRRHWTPVHLDFAVDDLPRAVARARAAGATLEFRGRGYDEIAL